MVSLQTPPNHIHICTGPTIQEKKKSTVDKLEDIQSITMDRGTRQQNFSQRMIDTVEEVNPKKLNGSLNFLLDLGGFYFMDCTCCSMLYL